MTIRLRRKVGVAKKILNNIEEFEFKCVSSDELEEGTKYKFDISYEDIKGYIIIHEKSCNQILEVVLELDGWGLSLDLETDKSLYALADQILLDHNL